MTTIATSGSICRGCGQEAGNVHQCPDCSSPMHPFCGTPVGPEGFGQPIRCPSCSSKTSGPTAVTVSSESLPAEVKDQSQAPLAFQLLSPSPIVAAFARAYLKAAAQPPSTSMHVDSVKSGAEQKAPQTSAAADKPNAELVVLSLIQNPCCSRSGHRATVQVVTDIAQRRKVLRWMIQAEKVSGDKLLFSKVVDKFPTVFKSATRRANLAKATDWWQKRERYLQPSRGSTVLSGRRESGRVRVNRKCLIGRGRRPSAWVTWLYPVLLDEFDRLRKAELKFDAPLLRQVALRQLQIPTAPFNSASVDSKGVLIASRLTPRWIQVFMEKHRIVLRSHTGKRQVSPEKQAQIEREVAAHLGELKRDFESGKLDENVIENVDETHFVIDFDNGKTLGFVAEKQIKYADVVSGGEGMTMVVRISGGPSGYIHPPMMIFTNANRSYPIRGVSDDVEGVCYRTGPKGWMDKRLFREFLQERRAVASDPRGRQKAIFLDNCSGHLDESECEEELQRLNARLRYLPPNATDLCQPADSFVIAKIKDVWSRMWNDKKIELIEDNEWQNKVRKYGSYSGKLKNPGKRFFLELAATAVKEVNAKRDQNGINYARKAMMRCGLSLSVDGTWRTTQLFPHLQEIIKKYPEEFAGKASTTDTVADEEEVDSVDEAHEENEMAIPGVINRAGNEVLV